MRNEGALVGFTAITNLADGIGRVALPIAAMGLTTSPALITGVGVTLTLPWLLVSLHAGVLADRGDRRRLAVVANLVRLGAVGVLLAAALLGGLSLPLLYGAGLTLGVAEVVASAAVGALVPAAVPARRLTRANSWIAGAETLMNEFTGPALGGLLVGIGVSVALGSAAAGFALGAVLLALLAGRFRAEGAPRKGETSVAGEIREGLAFLWNHRLLRTLNLTITVLGASWAAWLALLPLYAIRELRLDPSGYGLLISAIGIGGLTGALTTALINRLLGVRWALFADLIGTFLMVFVPVVLPSAWAVGAAAFLGGMGGTLWSVNSRTIAQTIVPDRLLGRYTAAGRMLAYGAMPLASLLAGFLAQFAGLKVAFAVFAAAALVLVVPFLRTVTPDALAQSETDHEKLAESGNTAGMAAVN
ncbi:MFS transporter [Nonomuraea typhae]|uniref:MFS transporter n=1 Tax=Nonomuraea typhae TaxID=2603600 RepID=UPI0012FAB33B|nr:MFS transporter [Nonomuraea typhae]